MQATCSKPLLDVRFDESWVAANNRAIIGFRDS